MADRSREQMASGMEDAAHRRQVESLRSEIERLQASLEGERKVREAAVDAAKRAREEVTDLVDELAKAELALDDLRSKREKSSKAAAEAAADASRWNTRFIAEKEAREEAEAKLREIENAHTDDHREFRALAMEGLGRDPDYIARYRKEGPVSLSLQAAHRLAEAAKPYAALAHEVDRLRHSDDSTCEHRLVAGNLRQLREALTNFHEAASS